MSQEFDPYYLWLGIPPEEQPPNHYRLLGLREFEDNREVISYALDQRSAHLRSFQAGKRGAESQKLLNEVAAAGVCLLDATKRRQYDEQLRARLGKKGPSPADAASAGAGSGGLPVASPLGDEPFLAPPGPVPRLELPAAAQRANPLLMLLLIGGAACLLLVPLLIAVGWWALSGRKDRPSAPPVVADVRPPKPKIEPPVEPPKPVSQNPGTVTPPPPVPPVAPAASDVRVAWVPEGTADFAIRQVNGQWVEFHESDEFRFDPPVQVTAEFVELTDKVRGLDIRLFADRMEFKTARQDWALRISGKWSAADDLPSFARREPRRSGPVPLRLNPVTHALVFTGREAVRVPVPAEIRGSQADFTIEAWLRLDPYQTQGTILATEGGEFRIGVQSRVATRDGPAMMISAKMRNHHGGFGPLVSGRWIHLALQRSGNRLQFFKDGNSVGRLPLPPGYALTSTHLTLGDAKDGWCGLIRDFRISQGPRYADSFTPRYKFAPDDRTLVLPDPRAVGGKTIKDLSGHNHDAERQGARWIPLTDEAQLAADRPDGTLDLVQAFAVLTETLEGDVLKWPRYVETRQASGRVRLLAPIRPPAEYDIVAELSRLEGTGGAFFGLSVAGKPALVVIDRNGRTGLVLKNTATSAASASGPPRPAILSDQPTTIEIKVRLSGTTRYMITISQGTKTLVTSTGPIQDLDVPPEFAIPLAYGMSYGSWDARIRLAHISLRTVTSEFPPPLLAALNQTPSSGPPVTVAPPVTPMPVAPVVAPPPAAAARKPVPAADDLAVKIAEARQIYEAELKQATKPAQKATLARSIQSAGVATRSDQTARYVLIDLARKVFIQAGEVDDALRLAKQLEGEYEVPRNELISATIESLNDATLVNDQRAALAKSAADLADELISAESYEKADALAAIAVQAANRQKDTDLKKSILQRRTQIARIVKQYNAVKPHLETLATRADDPGANLAAGKFYCLALEDWPRGLPQLAASGDTLFSEPAKLDLAAKAGDAIAQQTAAEGWLALSDQNKAGSSDDEAAILRRAKTLLQSAVGGLTGLDKVKAEKRLERLKDVPAPRKRFS